MKRTLVAAVFLCLFSLKARAQDVHHPGNLDCTAQLNSGQITPTIRTTTGPNSSAVFAPAATPATAADLGCSAYTYVQVTGLYDSMTITPHYSGPNVNNSAWDCNHTEVNYSVYNGLATGGYANVGGGVLYGKLDTTGTCVHDISVFPSAGANNLSVGRFVRHPIIAVLSWAHNDPALGHPGNLCSATSCYFPSLLVFTGGKAPTAWKNDFDGDAKSNLVVWRPSTGEWTDTTVGSSAPPGIVQWGANGDVPVPRDWDGDGKTDRAIWRPSNGLWAILRSTDGGNTTATWGVSGDIPVPGDYDGDGKIDFAIWRPSTAVWWILQSSTNTGKTVQWGTPTDIAVPGDYDGDGRTDTAVWRPSNATWFVINSSTGASVSRQLGVSTDKPVPGDYDGDGKTDFTVWRPSNGTWFTIRSSNGTSVTQQWGLSNDIPTPADFDGDGRTDFAIWRPGTVGMFAIITSTDGVGRGWNFSSTTGDVPPYKP